MVEFTDALTRKVLGHPEFMSVFQRLSKEVPGGPGHFFTVLDMAREEVYHKYFENGEEVIYNQGIPIRPKYIPELEEDDNMSGGKRSGASAKSSGASAKSSGASAKSSGAAKATRKAKRRSQKKNKTSRRK